MTVTIGEYYKRKPSGPLYHYTDNHGCIGIIKQQEFWATQIQFMNDAKEVAHAVDIAREIIVREFRSKGSEAFREMIESQLSNSEQGSNTFIISFSENVDQLSQWRAYCRESGACLGFDHEGLMKLCRKNGGFRLRPCVYAEDDKRSLVHEIVQTVYDQYEKERPKDDQESLMAFVYQYLRNPLHELGNSIKHQSFEEEREWRLIGGAFKFDTLHWRSGRDSIVPYFIFSLGAEPPLISACSGPARDSQLAFKGMRSFIGGQSCFKGGKVKFSKTHTPFRVL